VAFTVLKYYSVFPVLAVLPLVLEPWVESGLRPMVIAILAIAAAHLALKHRQRGIVRQHCNQPALEEGEEDFPMKLGVCLSKAEILAKLG